MFPITVLQPPLWSTRLAGGHSLGNNALKRELLLLAPLELHAHGRVVDDLLDSADVALQLLSGLELLAECLIRALELGGVLNHLLDLAAAELADGVGDGDVGATAGGLLSG